MRELKNNLINDKEKTMVHQMKRAEMNRSIMLQEKVRKAQEEEMKVRIALAFYDFTVFDDIIRNLIIYF